MTSAKEQEEADELLSDYLGLCHFIREREVSVCDIHGYLWASDVILIHWKLIPVAVSALFNKAGGLLMLH